MGPRVVLVRHQLVGFDHPVARKPGRQGLAVRYLARVRSQFPWRPGAAGARARRASGLRFSFRRIIDRFLLRRHLRHFHSGYIPETVFNTLRGIIDAPDGRETGDQVRQVFRGGITRPGVRIPRGGGQTGVTQGLLDDVHRGAAIERMRCVGVPEVMRRYLAGQVGALDGLTEDDPDIAPQDRGASLRVPVASEHRIVGTVQPALEREELPRHGRRDQVPRASCRPSRTP